MNCTDVQMWISSPLTSDVAVDTLYEISQHINSCEECQNWYEEVQELAQLWEDDTPVENLDLVTPVLKELAGRSAAVPQVQKNSGFRTGLAGLKLPVGTSMLNYGVAASITIALFGFGIFQHASTLAQGSLGLSTQFSHFINMISNL
ncbi:hypothetical protein [Alicyclobacillus sp. SO9]|uniref:hypothetical protein n=1 Tax=Alicyclobacillus sp. SO9 TaxID=2665646 RepID=UPI0018E79539|nr:hypothetical protein [Alicyclobacillus sp. SO9]QQE78975.1 hypothetical protein GI364_00130 [Alicyclobacillus sp. SO9]